MKNFKSDETGAAQIIEAAILYPVVFMILFFLIYIGLYILQCVTVESYAQKIALITAREIAHPGYIDEIGSTDNASVDYSGDGINIQNKKASDVGVAFAYRYIFNNFIDGGKMDSLKNSLTNLIRNNSIIGNSDGEIKVDITIKNYVVVQQVEVTATQELASFPVLEFFNINDGLTVSSTAVVSVNDSDEFVRNVDFVYDVIKLIGKKLGINIDNVRAKIDNFKKTLNIE